MLEDVQDGLILAGGEKVAVELEEDAVDDVFGIGGEGFGFDEGLG